jgi:hypothetical protein
MTDAEGRFTLVVDTARPPGVTFVGTRYEDRLYIGDPFRDVIPADYLVRVGPGATPIEFGNTQNSPVTPQAGSNPGGGGAAIIVIALLGLGALIWIAFARGRTPQSRRLLVEIANLDNRQEITALPDYDDQRAELLRRLRESA